MGQLVSIGHEIFSGFGCGRPGNVRAVFLGVCKAFGGILFPAVGRGVSGAGSGFGWGWRTAGGVLLFFYAFSLVLAGFSFWRGGGGVGAWARILVGSGTFVRFPSFLRSS